MSTYRTRNTWSVGLLVAGALVLAVPAEAQRFSRSGGGDDSRSDSRSDSRNDSRSNSRSESRPAPSSGSRTESRGSSSSSSTTTGGSSRWQQTAPAQAPARTAPAPSPTWRGGGNTTNTSPSPTWRGGNTPSAPSAPSANDGRFSPNAVGGTNRGDNPAYRNENPAYRNQPSQSAPRYGGGVTRGNPNWRPGTGPDAGNGTSNLPSTPSVPSRPGGIGNNGNTGSTGNNGGWTGRPGGIGNNGTTRKDGDIGDGTSTPPTRPGGVTPATPATPARPGSTSSPVNAWRAPDRVRPGGSPSSGRINPGSGATGTRGPRGTIGSAPGSTGSVPAQRPGYASRKPTYITPTVTSRPPRVDRNRWLDGTRHFGGRDFNIVPLGFYDPWACYRSSSPWFTDVRFYYPYYYVGPYYNGFYYSPFYIYGSWFPTYIYPERIIYVERRVYLRDVVSDGDYYDPYGGDVQFSLRDTMDDLKSAWLEGEGGRLLQHVNAAVPVRVYQKGVYKYSLEPEDYRDITKDALNRVDTVGFEWVNIDKKRSDEVVLTAKHTFRDPDGDRHVIRLTYTLEKARGSWWITETGTSAWNGDI